MRGDMRPYYDDGTCVIYHGDALDVLRSLPASSVDAIVADPPFKLSQEYGSGADADNLLGVASIWPCAADLHRLAKPGALAAIFYDTRILPLALQSFRGGGWKYLRAVTLYRRWGQASKMLGWMSTSDFVLIFAKPGAPFVFHGPVRHDVYVKAGPEAENGGHPAQKPLDTVTHLIQNLTPVGGLVVDPYMGSGTTLRAAKALGVRAIGIEIEERYCEIAAKRLGQEVLAL